MTHTHEVTLSVQEVQALIKAEIQKRYHDYVFADMNMTIIDPMKQYREESFYTDCTSPPKNTTPFIKSVTVMLNKKSK